MTYLAAAAPAMATSASWLDITPETPMAPIILPSTTIGTPPSSGKTPGTASSRRLPPPCAIRSCSAFVGRLRLIAVFALPMAMSTLVLVVVHFENASLRRCRRWRRHRPVVLGFRLGRGQRLWRHQPIGMPYGGGGACAASGYLTKVAAMAPHHASLHGCFSRLPFADAWTITRPLPGGPAAVTFW